MDNELKKMQLDVEMSPPANNVWHLNSKGSSSALGKLIDIASPSQVSNFATLIFFEIQLFFLVQTDRKRCI